MAESYVRANNAPEALRQYVSLADLLPNDIDVQLKAGGFLLLTDQFEDAKDRARRALEIDSTNSEAQMLVANALAGLDDLDLAVITLERAIQADPEHSRAYSNLGMLQAARGDVELAEIAFKKALELDPEAVDAYLILANFYRSSGRLADAEQSLLRAIAVEPTHVPANRALAFFYLATKRAPNAEPFLKAVVTHSTEISARMVLADYYVASSRPREAIPLLETVAATAPGARTGARWRQALAQYTDGRVQEAYATIDEVLAAEPDNVNMLLVKARFLLGDGRIAEARPEAEAAVAAEPLSAEAHYLLGIIHSLQENVDMATEAFSEVVRLDPSSSSAPLELSRLHLARGATETSVQLARDAMAKAPDNPAPRLVYVRGLMANGDLFNAESELEGLVRQYPGLAEVHSLLGVLRMLRRDPPKASQAFKRARELDPDLVEPLAGLVAIDVSRNQASEALAKVKAALARRPNHPGLLLLAARTYAAADDPARAEQALRSVINVEPANLAAYSMLGRLYVAQQKLDAARIELDTLARNTGSIAAHTMVAMILELQNKGEEAQARYEKILEIDRRAAVAANNLAWLYAERGGNLDVALGLAQTALQRLPEQPEVNDTLGWVYYKKDLASMASRYFEVCIERDPTNATYHYHLALADAARGNRGKARASLTQALELDSEFPGSEDAAELLAELAR